LCMLINVIYIALLLMYMPLVILIIPQIITITGWSFFVTVAVLTAAVLIVGALELDCCQKGLGAVCVQDAA
jgi:hypothetical protein